MAELSSGNGVDDGSIQQTTAASAVMIAAAVVIRGSYDNDDSQHCISGGIDSSGSSGSGVDTCSRNGSDTSNHGHRKYEQQW